MSVGSVLSMIEEFYSEHPKNIMSLYFTQKLTTSSKYRSFQPMVSSEVQNQILNMILPRIKASLRTNAVVQYNPIGVADGEIETIAMTEVEALNAFLASIDDEHICKEMRNLEIGKINFYCIQITHEGQNVLFFRQFSKMKKLRSGFLARLANDELIAMDGDFLGIDEDVDMIFADNTLIVLNHISLERVFYYRDAYKQKTDEAMGSILSQGVLVNIEQFAEDCCRDVRIMKRFTNIMSQGRLPLFFENYERVEGIVRDLELDIDFDESGKMIYREKSQLYHIVNLMSDAYFRSLIAERIGVSKTEEQL